MQFEVQNEVSHSIHSTVMDIANFLNLPEPQRAKLVPGHNTLSKLSEIKEYRDYLFQAVVIDKINPNDDLKMLQAFLDYYNLKSPFDLEKYIQEGEIIEVYGEDLVQIYRNRTFFMFCSYDICTLLTHPFPTLFRRSDDITSCLVECAAHYLTTAKTIGPMNIPIHKMQEHYARNNRVFEIEERWCSPLYSKITGQTMAIYASQVARHVGNSNVSGIGFVN